MTTMDKKGEIRSFTDQVRIICVKNDINKPTLGEKIGLDNVAVFNCIKGGTFKPDPVTYFKLEKEICGKDERYKRKLRMKYEKTLNISEMNDYMKASAVANTPKEVKKVRVAVSIPEKKEEPEKKEKTENKMSSIKEARKKFYKVLLANKSKDLSISQIEKLIKSTAVHNLGTGLSYIHVDKLSKFFEVCGFKEGSKVYNQLLELEIDCIGYKNDAEYELYEKLFMKKEDKIEVKEEVKEICEAVEADDNKAAERKEFSDILMRYLFTKGYTMRQAARTIGCSESEFKHVIDGDVCLSPYHVNRFKETLKMDDETVNKLVKLSNSCYEGHEIPKSILDYISSDMLIISTLSEIVRQNKGYDFWDKIRKEI